MQPLSRTCIVADHYSKVIEYVCMHPQCQLSRFLCSQCLLETSHKHNQQDNQHIVDNRDFYEMIATNVNQAKDKQQQKKYDIEKLIISIKQQIQEIYNQLKNVQNIIQQVEKGKLQNININHLENQLLNVKQHGFNQIDDQSLNNLINLPVQLQDLDIYKQLEDQANLIIQNAVKIKEWLLQYKENKYQSSQSQKIKEAKYQVIQIDDSSDDEITTGAISNDLKYIVSGGFYSLLKIWDYQTTKLIKSIKLNSCVYSCKFTEDSTLLYAGSDSYIYQFDVQNQFKELSKQKVHSHFIHCIYCISNKIILTSSSDKTIVKTDVDKKQQLLNIQAHNDIINGLDYNKSLNIIASGSSDRSIKLWNGFDGSLITEKVNAHNNDKSIKQVLLIINNNLMISLDVVKAFIIWDINLQTKQLEQLQLIKDSGYNISLMLKQQYIIAIDKNFIKVYSNQGQFVRQLDHIVDDFGYYNTIQLDSMKAVLIKGKVKLQVCKFDMD